MHRRWPAVASTLILALLLLECRDVAPIDTLRYSAYFVGVILLPGMLVWGSLMRSHERKNTRLSHLHTPIEDWVFGAATGYAMEIPAYAVARAAGHPLLYLVLPAAVLATLGVQTVQDRLRGGGEQSVRPGSAGAAWAFAGLAAFLTVWWSVTMFGAHPIHSSRIVDPDEYFHLALIGELRHHFPATYPYVQYDGGLTYQWFVHAHMAASTWVTGLSPELVYRRFDPLVLSLVAMLGTGILAMRLTGRLWMGPLSSGILVLVGAFDVTGTFPGQAAAEERFLQGTILLNSPTQTLAFALAPPVALCALEIVRRGSRSSLTMWIGLVVGGFALSGAKVTMLPMFACGFVAVALLTNWHRRGEASRALAGVLAVAVVIGLSTYFLYRGSEQPLTFRPLATARSFMVHFGIAGGGLAGELLVTASLLVSWLVCAAGAVGLFRDPGTRWDPRVWWLIGVAVAGYGATFLLAHGGMSQTYFGRSAAPFVAVLSAWGLSGLFPRGTTDAKYRAGLLAATLGGVGLLCFRVASERWRVSQVQGGRVQELPLLRIWLNLPALILIVVALWMAALVIKDVTKKTRSLDLALVSSFLVGLGLARTFAFLAGHYLPEPEPSPGLDIGTAGLDAAAFLRTHSDPSERIATNAHCGPARPRQDICDSRHFWMSALTQRRFVLEGWAYTGRTPDRWENDPFWNRALLSKNDELFRRPSGQILARFARRYDVRWLLADRRAGVDGDALDRLPGLKERWSEGNFTVYQVVSTQPRERLN